MPPPSPPDTLRFGEYLARTVCTECHGNDLQGDPFGGTPDLVIAAAYSFDDFLRLMQTGVALGERAVGLMSEVARSRFRYLTDAEIHALHTFLQRRAAQKTTPEAG